MFQGTDHEQNIDHVCVTPFLLLPSIIKITIKLAHAQFKLKRRIMSAIHFKRKKSEEEWA